MASRARAFVLVLLGLAGAVALIYLFLLLMPYLMVVLVQQAAQAPMHCWVKVVNQNGRGIPNYNCRVMEEHASWWPFSRNEDRVRSFQTDENGLFEYQSKGQAGRVFIGYPIKTQRELNPRHLLDDRYLSISALHQQSEIEKNPTGYLGSKENPYLLHVFTLGPPQRLLYNKIVIMLKDPKDYFCMDVLTGKTWESEQPEGDVAMADGLGTRENPAPCIVTVQAGPNCELSPVLDDWGLGPPKDGYSKEICWPKSWEPRHYSLLGLWFYYRIARSGSPNLLYGKVKFGVREKVNGAVIECFTNLQGERNLYFKGYEKSVFTTDPCQIADYISPPAP
jgi:hypothetical protein